MRRYPPQPRKSSAAALILVSTSIFVASAAAAPLSPEEAQARFKVADGLEVKLFASEPQVRQPVTMTFDDRGRLWVIQYLQYPSPAGLKPVEVDRYLRTRYDRKPEPPPKGPRGADRVTILEDTDGDGRADKAKDFVTGLNLASAMAIGYGGVFVGQAPYLLFYPDRNGDDIPDGDPEVLLDGFGMEDAHAVINSLQFGPDGWLYGVQGSTVTATVRGISFQQGIWRYHPVTRQFELFSEGGGNTWGLDFDRHGNALAGTNFNGHVLLHQLQGGYYVKIFDKHGPLHNPHAYGYFEHAVHEGWRGGHVTCGGIVYEGDLLPAPFRHSYIAANVLSNAVYWHTIEPDGSTFKTRFQGELLSTDDIWFRPIDCLPGPDGAVYVADWYDQRSNHVIPEDTWDKTNGRIWKISPRGSKPPRGFKLSDLSSDALVDLLSHANDWYARESRRILAERRDRSVLPRLRRMIAGSDERLALEALWALYVSGGWNEELAQELLKHPSADIRAWTVRLVGDERQASPKLQERLVELARAEPQATVRSQLAATAKRLAGPSCLAIVEQLLQHNEDARDKHIPLLIWWAVEDKAVSDRQRVLDLLADPEIWKLPLVTPTIVERIGRRYAAEGTPAGYAACARLLALAPDQARVQLLLSGMEKALAGQRLPEIPPELQRPLAELWSRGTPDATLVRFALRLGSPEAHQSALRLMADRKQSLADRLAFVEAIGQSARPDAIAPLLALVEGDQAEPLRLAALAAIEHFSNPEIGDRLLHDWSRRTPALRARAIDAVCSRESWAGTLLNSVDSGAIPPADITVDQLRRILAHKDPQLTERIVRRWGQIREATPGEKQAQAVVLDRILHGGTGDASRGHAAFMKHCGVCHTLFGEGNKIGPDLSGADRKNRNYLLLNVLDPSGSIRPEFTAHTLVLEDGRVLTGLIAESTPESLTLLDAKNQRTRIARRDIAQQCESPVSLMPEKILEQLPPQELCDLFSYLESDGPPQRAGK